MICRLCLKNSNNAIIDIFNNNNNNNNQEERICDIIEKYFWFKPDENDPYTNYICENCWSILKNFHFLYKEVENNQNALKFIIGTSTENSEINDIDIKYECRSSPDSVNEWQERKFKVDDDEKIDNAVSSEHEKEIELNALNKKRSTKNETCIGSRNKTKTKTTSKLKQQNNIDQKTISDKKFDEEDKMIVNFIKMICDICSKEERNFSNLKRHFKSIHKQNGYAICCNKKFFKRSWLVDHIGKHINPESFKCSTCGKTCNSRRTLRGHIYRMHESNPNETYQCDECGKAFKHKDILVRHSLTHIPEDQKKFKCEHCGKTYPVQSLLDQHIRIIHDKRYAGTCDICGKTYTNKEDANRHRMIVHEGVEKSKIKCKICSKEFSTKYQYYNHKTELHGDPNKKISNKCDICNKISANSEALKRHIEKVHKRIAKFHCTFCDKHFKTELSLKEHTATHTGEPLYICPHCPKTFTHNANMHHHRKHTHPLEFVVDKQWKDAKKQPWTQITSIIK